MDTEASKKLRRKVYLLFPSSIMILEAIFWFSSGTLRFWQGWVFCAVILSSALFIVTYFLKRAPEFLERRMKYKEKIARQKTIIIMGDIFFFLGFLIPGLDYRFGWSSIPVWLVLASDAMIILCYILVFLSFRENAFAGRTVEIFEGQKVIDTGPYAVVRHPMYAGVIPMYMFMPLALGSYPALLAFITACVIIILRLLNEEEILRRDLPGYTAYCEKVRYHLIPHVW